MYEWMCVRAYGKPDPANTDKPVRRGSSLAFDKKAISYFMNTTAKWNEASKSGNPTQSKKINALLKAVIKCETRGTGVPTRADRPFTLTEFRQLLDLVADDRFVAMMNLQYHLMCRCDDTAHVRKSVLKASTEFPGFLTCKINWSKNVHDDSNCPDQILLPCLSTKMCVYLSLAIWLEKWIQYGDGAQSQWLFVEGSTTRESCVLKQDAEGQYSTII